MHNTFLYFLLSCVFLFQSSLGKAEILSLYQLVSNTSEGLTDDFFNPTDSPFSIPRPAFGNFCKENISYDSIHPGIINCERAYFLRYNHIDSTLALSKRVLKESSPNSWEHAYALNNMAYVAYQQMDFAKARRFIDRIRLTSKNQLELLCGDVMDMKIAQRENDGREFFVKRNSANSRINRIKEELGTMDSHQRIRYLYACSEFHIVSSTYYLYLEQIERARSEINEAKKYISFDNDLTQWLYYNYMIGAGDIIVGEEQTVLLKEFDILFSTYMCSHAAQNKYFEANALQSLSMILSDSLKAFYLYKNRRNELQYLAQNYGKEIEALSDTLPLVLAKKSYHIFRRYKDGFQTASALRTVGEVYFSFKQYRQALNYFYKSLNLMYFYSDKNKVEVPAWLANIYEKISLSYSAITSKQMSDYYRNLYLDLLDSTRQNKEYEIRKDELLRQQRVLCIQLVSIIVLFALTILLIYLWVRHSKRSSSQYLSRLVNFKQIPRYQDAIVHLKELTAEISQILEFQGEELKMKEYKAQQYVLKQVELRAVVSQVKAIFPYLDRILGQVNRLSPDHDFHQEDMQYISDLSSEIIAINDTLTTWIQITRGELKPQIKTFNLKEILDVIRLSDGEFKREDLTLEVNDTSTDVKADPQLTLFMINTLVGNARKFTEKGGQVSVNVSEEEQYVEVQIADTGIGLSEEEVNELNHSKLYNPSVLGNESDRKGFGFGIMNCKGIINKYKAMSSIFDVCDFGIKSQLGKGTTVWFKLPRVVMTLMFCLSFLGAYSQDLKTSSDYYNQAYEANINGEYAKAYQYGDSAIARMGLPMDTALCISIWNEMAIAAQAEKEWDQYYYANRQCVLLHRLYSQDNALPTDCYKLERLNSDTQVYYVLLILLSILCAPFLYFFIIRIILKNNKSVNQLVSLLDKIEKHIYSLEMDASSPPAEVMPRIGKWQTEFTQQIAALDTSFANFHAQDNIIKAYNESKLELEGFNHHISTQLADYQTNHLKIKQLDFELSRYHVFIQILENALSTIKHETMYYPARIKQIVSSLIGRTQQERQEELKGLRDLLSYYKTIYASLYEQVERCLLPHKLTICPMSSGSLIHELKNRIENHVTKNSLYCSINITQITECKVITTPMLIDLILSNLVSPFVKKLDQITLSAERKGDQCFFHIFCSEQNLPYIEKKMFFSPLDPDIKHHIVRQLMKDLDEVCHFPGLRLKLETSTDGLTYIFSLLCKDKKE